jgi:hypothetical protein
MLYRPLLFLLALGTGLAALPAEAQSPRNFGSVYSRFGLGERVTVPSSQSAMMGGAGVALRSATYTSLANPALWSDGQLVTLAFGAEVQGLRAEDGLGGVSRLTGSSLTGLQVRIPIYEDRLGVAAGFQPYTRVNYLVARDGMLVDADLPGDTLLYRVNLEGTGGLYQAQLGFGYRVSPALSVGVSGQALFGVLEDAQRTTYQRPAALPETRVARRTRMWGYGVTLGALGSASSVLGSRDLLSVGAAVTLPTRLEARRVRTVGTSLDADTLSAVASGQTTLPLQASLGASYVANTRWTLAADVSYEPWSDFESDFTYGGYAPGTEALRDRFRVGGGVQVTPAGVDRNAGYLARTTYRLGGYYDRAFYAPADRDIGTVAMTGGLSLPGLAPGARFDLGFEAGTRGTTDAGLVRDLFIRGTATLNFGERWFLRRRFG